MKNNENKFDSDELASFFLDGIEQVKTSENPLLLKEFYKTFKKSVPLTLRSYFIGYMLKSLAGNTTRRSSRYSKNHDKNRLPRDRKNLDPSKKPEPRPMLDKDLSTTLFIGIGRNRRVFPRDIVGLLTQAANVDRDHIGEIRILENYSFVQVLISEAEQAISKLNGYDYRGRKITVSYSKKKDSSDVSTDSETSSNFSDENDADSFKSSFDENTSSEEYKEENTSAW